jgi:GNAT superfamily N-acetyltransferase
MLRIIPATDAACMLLGGRYLYVADLASLPAARSKGHGKALMAHMEAIARHEGCTR